MTPPSKTETELRLKPTDPLLVRCLKLLARTDWKGVALTLAALGGIGGAIWNKVDSVVDKALASKTQQGVYVVLASKLDDISVRLTALEAAHAGFGKIPMPMGPSKPVTPDNPVPGSESGQATPAEPATATVAAVDVDGVPDDLFQAVGLPTFQAIQQHAQSNELPKLIRKERSVSTMVRVPGLN